MSHAHLSAANRIATLVLAHGAGAGEDHPWMRRSPGACGARHHDGDVQLPVHGKGIAGAPDRPPVLEAALIDVWRDVARDAKALLFAGGKSMGGRMATHVAARHAFDPAPSGIVVFGYPLHPPGAPTKRRDKHLPDIDVPMLFLSGTKDAFGTPEELTGLAAWLADGVASALRRRRSLDSAQGKGRRAAPRSGDHGRGSVDGDRIRSDSHRWRASSSASAASASSWLLSSTCQILRHPG